MTKACQRAWWLLLRRYRCRPSYRSQRPHRRRQLVRDRSGAVARGERSQRTLTAYSSEARSMAHNVARRAA